MRLHLHRITVLLVACLQVQKATDMSRHPFLTDVHQQFARAISGGCEGGLLEGVRNRVFGNRADQQLAQL